MVKICFAAIFRNESSNVYRCLDAVKDIIDCVSICDTGSEDNTVELIEKWGKENNIPTAIHNHIFRNFGHNRTLSFTCAKESYPECDYCLLIDADMVLKIEDNFDKEGLNEKSYLFQQGNATIKYWNTRLISMKGEWECVGVTHEYWQCNSYPGSSGTQTDRLESIWIDDIGDGGHKEDKFERDISLLLHELNHEKIPDNLRGRYMFYLAESYKNNGDNAKSIYWYQKRIEHGGWIEELFYSQMKIGLACKDLEGHERAAGELLKAWNMKPNRAEPLYHLAKMYRAKGYNRLAYEFSRIGKKIPYPTNDSLFVNHNVYNYLFDFEISITAYYLGKYSQGLKSSRLILNSDKAPEHIKDQTRDNIKHYINYFNI